MGLSGSICITWKFLEICCNQTSLSRHDSEHDSRLRGVGMNAKLWLGTYLACSLWKRILTRLQRMASTQVMTGEGQLNVCWVSEDRRSLQIEKKWEQTLVEWQDSLEGDTSDHQSWSSPGDGATTDVDNLLSTLLHCLTFYNEQSTTSKPGAKLNKKNRWALTFTSKNQKMVSDQNHLCQTQEKSTGPASSTDERRQWQAWHALGSPQHNPTTQDIWLGTTGHQSIDKDTVDTATRRPPAYLSGVSWISTSRTLTTKPATLQMGGQDQQSSLGMCDRPHRSAPYLMV